MDSSGTLRNERSWVYEEVHGGQEGPGKGPDGDGVEV